MKKIITLLLLALLCGKARAQDTTIYLTIPDATVLQSVQQNSDGTVTPIFTTQGINNIIANYTFTKFQQAFPGSRLPSSQMVYGAVANSTKVGSDLNQAYPDIFPGVAIEGPPILIGYYPNDYSSIVHPCSSCIWENYDWYLDYIYAPDAWAITHGDPSVVIGVTDDGFFLKDSIWDGNPDLNSKVAVLEDNDFPNWSQLEPEHGTLVAGLIAGGTDNDTGYPAIGFNCMLDLSANMSETEMLYLSGTRGRRILNGSWVYDNTGTATLQLSSYFAQQGVYNEIYENGTIACFAAGNRNLTTTNGNTFYLYPASLDHNISVTGVMGENCSWVNGTGIGGGCDEHNITTGDSAGSYHHNSRVDICAPGVRVGGLQYDSSYPVGNNDRYYSHDRGWGTSFASPLVAGTLGLMVAENTCLSPYQLEYLLKESSRDIYSVPDNAYLAGPTRWTGRLGAGALNAGNAVSMSEALNCNDPSTQTFFIVGVELNDICAPGHASDSVKPKLSVILENGTPPYIFKWEAYGGNTTTLDDYTSATPTIETSSGANLAYYRLTVYDNSPIQKVANRDVEIHLTTADTFGLAMRDSYLDMLDQPNSQGTVDPREGADIFSSPDIWNRQVEDGDTVPQIGQYFSGGEPNYMYMRIRNVGCADYNASNGAVVHAYWTVGSTGESWSADWETTNVAAAGGGTEPGGREITAGSGSPIAIPTLHPGDSYIANIPWNPIEPELYVGTPSYVDVCFLARITEPLKSTLGMAFTETSHTGTNVRNNNHIVTRNTGVVNLGHARGVGPMIHRVYVSNTESSAQTFSLQMSRDRDTYKHFAGNLSEYIYVTVTLDSNLFTAWQSGGFKGNYAAMNAQSHTVTYDPATPMQLDGITLQPGDMFYADLSFALRDTSAPINVAVHHQKIYFRQLSYDSSQQVTVYGNFTYIINIDADTQQSSQRHAPVSPAAQVPVDNRYNVYPNPAANVLSVAFFGDKPTTTNIELLDITGRLIMKQEKVSIQSGNTVNFNLSGIDPGIYLINIQDATGYKNTYKITKIE